MKEESLFRLLLSACVIWLAMVATAVGNDIFLDDFTGDNTKARFVMEAENYSSRKLGDGADWPEVDGVNHRFLEGPDLGAVAPTARDGARGNYMQSIGRQIGSIPPTSEFYHGPFLYYKIRVETPGTYRLYARWTARDGFSDSLYAFVVKPDSRLLRGAGPDYFMFHQFRRQWKWDNRGVKNTTHCAGAGFPATAVWKIPKEGDYTLCIALREKATALDALAFQTDNLPSPTNSEPPQSLFVPEKIKLSAEEITNLNRIRIAITENAEAIKKIDAALKKDQATCKNLELMLEKGEYGNLSYNEVVEAQREVQSAIDSGLQSRKVLEQSSEELRQRLLTTLKRK